MINRFENLDIVIYSNLNILEF